MTEIHHSASAAVARSVAFAYVDDYRTVPEWFFGITQFDSIGDHDHDLGARYDAALRIGPKSFGSILEVTEWEQDRVIVLESIRGFTTRSRWRFDDAPDGETRLTVDFAYELPGGLAGKALARIVEPFAVQAVRQTEATLRRKLAAL
ncbi:SRPBCC family protein [Rhodococcus sp. HNM0569]|uniref:SRPBCC family protein n=1 Tax=Rhodococcus sp. HNM0569 TaxID=2716340 RepID=UPI00146A57B0|nr:SRPBCC family protein [Rhodococcus sp. HNM0569]